MENPVMPLVERWQQVRHEIDGACRAAGRMPQEVRLIAVSKRHPAAMVAALAACGQQDFGESYLQEACAKQDILNSQRACSKVQWHCIGHVQTNKVRDIPGRFEYLHSLDSARLASALNARIATQLNAEDAEEYPLSATQKVFVQVNVGEESQKAGVMPADVSMLVEHVLGLPHLVLDGFMCLPPVCGCGQARRYFALLREIREEQEERFACIFPHLSMGMSDDFVEAIAEGASMVRVGTRIFGERLPA